MKRYVLMTAVSLALATPAFADPLFEDSVDISVINSPGSDNAAVMLNGGPTAIGAAGVELSITTVSGGGGKEWVIFSYATTTGGILSTSGEYWGVQQYLVAKVDVNLIADFTQFTDAGGTPFNQTASIFGQTLMDSPTTGLTGNGEGTGNYAAPFAAGSLPNLGADAPDFSEVQNPLGTVGIYGFNQALEFEPQNAGPSTPEPSTWLMGLIGFGALAGFGLMRGPRGSAVSAA
jgi:hypothetical protein